MEKRESLMKRFIALAAAFLLLPVMSGAASGEISLPDTGDPAEDPLAAWDKGAGMNICGFTFTIPAKTACTVTVTLKKL